MSAHVTWQLTLWPGLLISLYGDGCICQPHGLCVQLFLGMDDVMPTLVSKVREHEPPRRCAAWGLRQLGAGAKHEWLDENAAVVSCWYIKGNDG